MKVSIPPVNEAAELLDFAQRFLRAAELLPADDAELLFPRCQMYGHAAELAIKSFLERRGVKAPKGSEGHNLIDLAADAVKHGLILTDKQRTNVIAPLSDIYFERALDGKRYASRYSIGGTQVWVTPPAAWMAELVRSIVDQAAR